MNQNLPARREEQSPKNRILAFTLAVFWGYLGLHRFYTGKFWTGILMLLTAGGFGIWWFIDVLILLMGRFKDAEGRVLGPPRRYARRPAAHIPPQSQRPRQALPPKRDEDEVSLDELLEDPLEDKFRELEKEMNADSGRSDQW